MTNVAINHRGMWRELKELGLDLDHEDLTTRVITRVKARLAQLGKGLWPMRTNDTPAGIELFAAYCTEEVLRANTAKAREELNTEASAQQIIESPKRYRDSLPDGFDATDVMKVSVGLSSVITKLLLGQPERSEEPQEPPLWLMGWALAPSAIKIGAVRLAGDIRLDLSTLVSQAKREIAFTDIGDAIGSVGEENFKRAVLIQARAMARAMLENQPPEQSENDVPAAVNIIAFAALQERIATVADRFATLSTNRSFSEFERKAAADIEPMLFTDRTDAGEKLAPIVAAARKSFRGWSVIGLARGGIITAAPIARRLHLPLHALCIDDLEIEGSRFFATGFGDGCWFHDKQTRGMVTPPYVSDAKAEITSPELETLIDALRKRQRQYNGSDLVIPKRAIVVDDELVSGRAAFTAIAALRARGACEVLLATPVVPYWMEAAYEHFHAIWFRHSQLRQPTTGMYYEEFADTPDDDVIAVTHH